MAIEKVNEEIDLEIAPDSAQEITAPMMEGDAMMLDDGSAIVNPVEGEIGGGAGSLLVIIIFSNFPILFLSNSFLIE